MATQQEKLTEFQIVTGASKDSAQKYLQSANWNAQLAISNYLDSGEQPDTLNPLALQPTPPPVSLVPMENEEHVDTIPGLYSRNKLIPLRSILVKAKILHFIGDVQVTQHFMNNTDNPIEAVFKFEHHNATLTNFEVDIDGKIFKGICKSTEDARNDYDDAIASSHSAYLLERGEKHENVIQVSVGSLPPNKQCKLVLRYIMELDAENGNLHFILPLTKCPIRNVLDQSALQLSLDVSMPSDIISIKSLSHDVQTKIYQNSAEVILNSLDNTIGKEFNLSITIQEPHQPASFIETFSENENSQSFFDISDLPILMEQKRSTTTTTSSTNSIPQEIPEKPLAVMLSLFPKIETEDDTLTEMIFLIDQSGSMSGHKINQAKNALQLFLRSLPFGTKFNIIGFGTRFKKLFSTSQALDSATLTKATNHVDAIKADLGGTQILSPLQDIFITPTDSNYPRQIFCLTDGEVDNTSEVLDFVKKNIGIHSRIFTFGIGADASKALVRGIAKYGKGKAEFIASGERMESKVLKQLKYALQPVLKHINVNWGDLPIAKNYSKIQNKYPSIFDGDRLLVYAFIESTRKYDGKHAVKITATTGETNFTWDVSVDFDTNMIKGSHVHRLAANQLIRSMEEDTSKEWKEDIITMGTEWGLVTKFTSYIVVQERSDEAIIGEMNKVVVGKQIENSLGDTNRHRSFNLNQLDDYATVSQERIHRMKRLILETEEIGVSTMKSLSQQSESMHEIRQACKIQSRPLGFNVFGAIAEGIQSAASSISSLFSASHSEKSVPSRSHSYTPKSASRARGNKSSMITNADPISETLTPRRELAYYCDENSDTEDNFFNPGEPNISMEKSTIASLSLSSTTSNVHKRPLDEFVLLQDANGSFLYGEEFSRQTGISMDEITSTLPNITFKDEFLKKRGTEDEEELKNILWITVIALAFLHKKFHELEDEWSLIAEKATKFVKRAVTNDFNNLLGTAQQLFF